MKPTDRALNDTPNEVGETTETELLLSPVLLGVLEPFAKEANLSPREYLVKALALLNLALRVQQDGKRLAVLGPNANDVQPINGL